MAEKIKLFCLECKCLLTLQSIMYYIYSLSFNEIPFYVGMTNNPVMRFRGHYYWEGCLTYNYLRYNLIAQNRTPKMQLVCYCETRNQALELEAKCITLLSQAGFNLLNDRYHRYGYNIPFTENIARPPIYEHFNKLPPKWFTKELRLNIFNQQLNVSKINYTYQWRLNG